MIEVGQIYKHFKGNYYKVVNVVTDAETQEDIIIYKSLKKSDNKTWCRTAKNFEETVKRDNYEGTRFTYVNLKDLPLVRSDTATYYCMDPVLSENKLYTDTTLSAGIKLGDGVSRWSELNTLEV